MEITELQALVISNLTGLKINNWFKCYKVFGITIWHLLQYWTLFIFNIQTVSVITILCQLPIKCNFEDRSTFHILFFWITFLLLLQYFVLILFGKKYFWVRNYDITEITELKALVIWNLTILKINNWLKMLQSVWYYIMTVITILNLFFKHSNVVCYYDITLITCHM